VGAARRVTDTAIRWLKARGDRPLLLFLHYFDVHSHYDSLPRYERLFTSSDGRFDGSTGQLAAANQGEFAFGPEDARHVALLYDAGIRQLDAELGRLFAFLRDDGWLEKSYLIVTSDHGEEFLDHGGFLHSRNHYREVLRVPLIWLGPSLPAGIRITTPVSLVDVLPTLLGLLGIPVPSGIDGIDLRPFWEAPGATGDQRPILAESGPTFLADRLRSVRRGRYKLLLDLGSDARELYDLTVDPAERHDLSDERPELVSSLLAELDHPGPSTRSGQEALPLSTEVRERLRELGYVE
jgi:arylsulfatase A-like enzyme